MARNYTLRPREEFPDFTPTEFSVIRHGRILEVIPVHKFVAGEPSSGDGDPEKRGKITGMSSASWGRMICLFSRIPALHGFATLTYPDDWRGAAKSGERSKQAFLNWLKKLRREWPDVVGGVWILEFQKRGAPHFQIWPRHEEMPNDFPVRSNWVSESWQRFGGGRISNWEAVRMPDAAARYAGKEGGKRLQKQPPENWSPGRFWGKFGDLGIEDVEPLGKFALEDLPDGVNFREDGKPYRTNFTSESSDT